MEVPFIPIEIIRTDRIFDDEAAFDLTLIDAASQIDRNPMIFITDSYIKAANIRRRCAAANPRANIKLYEPDLYPNDRDMTAADIVIYNFTGSLSDQNNTFQISSPAQEIWMHVDPRKTDYLNASQLLICNINDLLEHARPPVPIILACHIYVVPVEMDVITQIPNTKRAINAELQSLDSANDLIHLIYEHPDSNVTAQYWFNRPRKTYNNGRQVIIGGQARGGREYDNALYNIAIRCDSIRDFTNLLVIVLLQSGSIVHVPVNLIRPVVHSPGHPLNELIPNLAQLCMGAITVRLELP